MTTKGHLWLFLAIALALGLAACSSAPAPSPTAVPAAPTKAPVAAPTTAAASTPTKAPAAPTAAPAAAATAPAAAAPAAQPVVLKHASTVTTGLALSEAQIWFWKEVEARTKGRVKTEFYWTESLAKAPEVLDATSSGLADTGEVIGVYHPAKTPLATIQALPFLQVSAYEAATLTNAVWDGLPELRAEFDKFGVRYLYTTGVNTYTLFSKKPVRKLEDIKGMKIRGAGDLNTWVSAAGGTPVAMTFPEMYTGLERGMMDGTLHVYSTARAYKWQEVIKYATEARAGAIGNMMVSINNKSWAKISPEDQKIITDLSRNEWPKKLGDLITADETASQKVVLDAGVEKITLAPDEWSKWEALAKPIWDKWVDDREKQGLPAKKALELWQATLKKIR